MNKLLTVLTALAVVLAISHPAAAEDCMDCHYSGKHPKAPIISVLGGSAHTGLACTECHPGMGPAPADGSTAGATAEGAHCPPESKPVKCSVCHADQTATLAKSSHGKNLQEYIKKEKGSASLQDICLTCHGNDVHHIIKKEDENSPVNRAQVYKTCLNCHNKVQPIAIDTYIDSIHGTAAAQEHNGRSAVCTDCHGSHYIEGMDIQDSSVFFSNIPETCGKCHANEVVEYQASKHWKKVQDGYRDAPTCTNCHGEHGIRTRRDPKSPTWVGNITQTCAHCHESQMMNAKFMLPKEMVKSFLDSYHGLSGSLGDVRAANCASCHGNHAILPSSDPDSSVNPANLNKTCGGCHPGAEKRFINEPIHKTTRTESSWIVDVVRYGYMLLILFTIGGMISHNFLDLLFKSTRGLPYHKEETLKPRMNVNERFQHLFLALSFIALAISGLALRYPDSIFAVPFSFFSEGALVRRWVHRGAAATMVALAVYHLAYLILTKRGRATLMLMLPKKRDLTDAANVLNKYTGRNNDKLTLPHYAYVEKAEYWALIWGTVVMTITGAMLLFTNRLLGYMPMWVLSDLAGTIHLYEAILAVSAIIVWHGYWSILDPEYYPLNLAFILGNPRQPKTGPLAGHGTEAETRAPEDTPKTE